MDSDSNLSVSVVNFQKWTTISSGIFAFTACLISISSIFMHLKHYKKPLLQRFVVRIQLMIPIYSFTCFLGLLNSKLSEYTDAIREIYEAFVIYTFFCLMTNFLGGEREIIISMQGNEPIQHPWPFNKIFNKLDISDPYSFLMIKRGILQYAWLKPFMIFLIFLFRITNTYKEGEVTIFSPYMWLGLIYNFSVSLSLYCLTLFWKCLYQQLKPFRPIPKFLCIKMIIFAAYWQGFVLSFLNWLGYLNFHLSNKSSSSSLYIQNTLLCHELILFAIAHWYAFSWKDYSLQSINSTRLPLKFAIRDAFGIVDLIQDFKQTLNGHSYKYRSMDSSIVILDHPESSARIGRIKDGLRYSDGGKSKYWLPPKREISKKKLTHTYQTFNQSSSFNTINNFSDTISSIDSYNNDDSQDSTSSLNPNLIDISQWDDPEDNLLYDKSRNLPYGDFNYPVMNDYSTINFVPYALRQNNFASNHLESQHLLDD